MCPEHRGGHFKSSGFSACPALARIVQLAHQVILVLALRSRGLGVPCFLGAFAGLHRVRVDALQRPLLVAAGHKVPDLGLCTVGGVHAHQINVFVRQRIADAGAAIAGGLQLPALAQPAGAAPLVQPCAFHDAAQRQIDHLAGEPVADAPAPAACVHELPLLPRMACVAPQLDGGAVLRVEILYFQHLPVGGFDDVKFVFQDQDL